MDNNYPSMQIFYLGLTSNDPYLNWTFEQFSKPQLVIGHTVRDASSGAYGKCFNLFSWRRGRRHCLKVRSLNMLLRFPMDRYCYVSV